MKTCNFMVPFTGFSTLSRLSCFAAIYVHLEGLRGDGAYECAQEKGQHCTVCGNCRSSNQGLQQEWYFAFGALSGVNGRYGNFDGTLDTGYHSDSVIEFCMGYAGYEYRTVTEDFAAAVRESIDRGYPILAVLHHDEHGACRVITGYDDNGPLVADPQNSQNPDAVSLTYEEIAYLFVITGRGTPKYTLLDGLKNMEASLTFTLEQVWDDYRDRFNYWDDLQHKPFEETKARFARAVQMSWNFDHCHNVAEVFRHRMVPGLEDARFDGVCQVIDAAYDSSHNCQWAMMGLYDCRDWNKREWCSKEEGLCMYARWTIEQLKKNDEAVRDAVRKMIGILEQEH